MIIMPVRTDFFMTRTPAFETDNTEFLSAADYFFDQYARQWECDTIPMIRGDSNTNRGLIKKYATVCEFQRI
jgi:hypothetical protein